MNYKIGIDSQFLDAIYQYQESSKWCWAASMEMAMAAYGLHVDQQDFAYDLCGLDSYGGIQNCPASANQIDFYLNSKGIDRYGTQYKVNSRLQNGYLPAWRLIRELENGNPIIVAYIQPGMNIGHAVLITGAEITENPFNGRKEVTRLILRDPANTFVNRLNKGRRVVQAGSFMNSVYASWVPKVSQMPNFGFTG